MKKKIIITILSILVIGCLGCGSYFYLSNNSNNNNQQGQKKENNNIDQQENNNNVEQQSNDNDIINKCKRIDQLINMNITNINRIDDALYSNEYDNIYIYLYINDGQLNAEEINCEQNIIINKMSFEIINEKVKYIYNDYFQPGATNNIYYITENGNLYYTQHYAHQETINELKIYKKLNYQNANKLVLKENNLEDCEECTKYSLYVENANQEIQSLEELVYEINNQEGN